MSTALSEKESKELELAQCENTRPHKVYVPRADIYESPDKIIVKTDMPGVAENNIDITLENNVLTINGSVEKTCHEGFSLALSEYGTGDYRRAFTLSNSIDKENIEACLKNGVLTLTLPKSKSLLPKKISVKAQ